MLTFTQRKQQAARLCGIHYQEPEMELIATNINNADKLFMQASRIGYTVQRRTAKVKDGVQFYRLAADMHRVTSVQYKYKDSTTTLPLIKVVGIEQWNALNTSKSSGIPQYYFIDGGRNIGLYPIPSEDNNEGLVVDYEPRPRDLGVEDMNFKAKAVYNTPYIENQVGLPNGFVSYMENDFYIKVTSGEDGNWYKVEKVINNNKILLDNRYLGMSGNDVSFVMGQCPLYPEEYHEAAIYYAAFKFFSMRKDTDSAAMYSTLFEKALREYKANYASSTTSEVMDNPAGRIPTIQDMFINSTIRGN